MSGAEGGLQRSPRCRLSEVEGRALIFKKGPRGQPPSMDETGVRDWEDGWSQEVYSQLFVRPSQTTILPFCMKVKRESEVAQSWH